MCCRILDPDWSLEKTEREIDFQFPNVYSSYYEQIVEDENE